ncbi:MAG: hypothetical protein HOC49_06415 [Candidatus Marinimicrobia bacterium]|nr:hypothetical protein [Candidatus Neomarinimicrobiota bacterium]MBT6418473.1 hypothetical protein [Candidatus Neomarinimicrobiota bacterium]
MKIYVLLISLALFACEDENDDNQYEYTAYYGKSLRICVQGEMEINIEKDSTITGTWKTELVEGFSGNDVGPQIGTGELIGGINDGKLYLQMNPGFIDNNIDLTGGGIVDEYSGTWVWISFAGITSSGSFELKKK